MTKSRKATKASANPDGLGPIAKIGKQDPASRITGLAPSMARLAEFARSAADGIAQAEQQSVGPALAISMAQHLRVAMLKLEGTCRLSPDGIDSLGDSDLKPYLDRLCRDIITADHWRWATLRTYNGEALVAIEKTELDEPTFEWFGQRGNAVRAVMRFSIGRLFEIADDLGVQTLDSEPPYEQRLLTAQEVRDGLPNLVLSPVRKIIGRGPDFDDLLIALNRVAARTKPDLIPVARFPKSKRSKIIAAMHPDRKTKKVRGGKINGVSCCSESDCRTFLGVLPEEIS